jgi:FkbM family methyltransferase
MMTSKELKIDSYQSAVDYLWLNPNTHKPDCDAYSLIEESLKKIGTDELARANLEDTSFSFVALRKIRIFFPFLQMGSVSTIDLLRVDELVMFAYYDKHIEAYEAFFDLGANVGLHSLVAASIGAKVIAYEPDKEHFGILKNNVTLNGFDNVECRNAAIGIANCDVQFIRVLGNTTSSHIKGEKANPYGELEEFTVRCDELNSQLAPYKKSLLKIDIEGMEAKLIQSISKSNWQKVDAFVEVGTMENAKLIFEYCKSMGVKIYTQQSGWLEISDVSKMPIDYKGGSIFLTCQQMRWN